MLSGTCGRIWRYNALVQRGQGAGILTIAEVVWSGNERQEGCLDVFWFQSLPHCGLSRKMRKSWACNYSWVVSVQAFQGPIGKGFNIQSVIENTAVGRKSRTGFQSLYVFSSLAFLATDWRGTDLRTPNERFHLEKSFLQRLRFQLWALLNSEVALSFHFLSHHFKPLPSIDVVPSSGGFLRRLFREA